MLDIMVIVCWILLKDGRELCSVESQLEGVRVGDWGMYSLCPRNVGGIVKEDVEGCRLATLDVLGDREIL